MPAAKYVEATLSTAGTFTSAMEFRGRVNVLIAETETPWSGTVNLQRRYAASGGGFSEWMTVAVMIISGLWSFVEHEQTVEYRVGTVGGLSGDTPLARLSQ